MTKGYPDWRPPSAPGTLNLNVTRTNAIADLVPSPGAGFRLVLYTIMIVGEAAGGLIFVDEVTTANVFVRTLMSGSPSSSLQEDFDYGGVPLGAVNKIRLTAAPANFIDVHITTRTEAV